MILILESYFSVIVFLQHLDACIYQSCEVGDRSSQGLKSHPSNQLFIMSDVFQFRHGLVHVRWVATPNGPKKNAVSFTPDLTRAINTVPSFMQLDIAQRLPVVQKVALGTTVRWLGNGIRAIRPRMRSQTFEALITIQQQWTILTGVTQVSSITVNTTHETIGFIRSNKSTKILQGCTILVHERGEHRRSHPKHRQWRGGGGPSDTALDCRRQLLHGCAAGIRLHHWDWPSTAKWRLRRRQFSVFVIQALGSTNDESMCKASALDFALEITLLIPSWPSRASWLDFWCIAVKDLKDPRWMTSLIDG